MNQHSYRSIEDAIACQDQALVQPGFVLAAILTPGGEVVAVNRSAFEASPYEA